MFPKCTLTLCWREIRPDTGKTIKNEFVASHVRENLQQTHFQLFCQHLALFLSNKVLEKAIN